MTTPVQHVGLGMSRATRAPGRLRAIVGPGYLVAVIDADGRAAAMTHIPTMHLALRAGGGSVDSRIANCLRAFEEVGGRSRGARVEIVGGADILRVYPHSQRQIKVDEFVREIETALNGKRFAVEHNHTGGDIARRVQLTLPAQSLEIERMSKGRRHSVAVGTRDTPRPRRPQPANDVVVNMGCMEIARPPNNLVAVLGSCVGIALFDRTTGIGGLAHVMLPHRQGRNGGRAKYADTAVPMLREALAGAGAATNNLEAKIVGGASVLAAQEAGGLLAIGRDNTSATKRALADAGISVVWEDTGGNRGRRIMVDFEDFEIQVRMLERAQGFE